MGLSRAAAGLACGGELVLLRRALEEDGWKVVTEGEGKEKNEEDDSDDDFDSDDDYSSSSEEDEGDSSDDDDEEGARVW